MLFPKTSEISDCFGTFPEMTESARFYLYSDHLARKPKKDQNTKTTKTTKKKQKTKTSENYVGCYRIVVLSFFGSLVSLIVFLGFWWVFDIPPSSKV